ncbi:MAG: ABC transporter permease [Bacteroidia bacterium]
MNKIKLIIAREYMTKIKSRPFILITILGPLLYLGLIFGSAFLTKMAGDGTTEIALVDKSGLFTTEFEENEKLKVSTFNLEPDEIERSFVEEGWEMTTVYIPANIKDAQDGLKIFYKENPGMSTIERIERTITYKLRDVKMQEEGIDKSIAEKIQRISIDAETKAIGEDGAKTGNIGVASALAFGSAFLLYFFIFIYGSMVLRGVQEEKTSRISEVIISSVKPFELMMGKIIGNALLGFTQFAFWIILIMLGSVAVGSFMPDMLSGMQDNMAANPQMQAQMSQGALDSIMQIGSDFNIFETVFYFLIYFIGGYLLYSSLFAAVASAVDGQQDLQQFMLPISMPLILSMVLLGSIMQDSNSGIAVFFSIFPLTSPIVMMARIPFEVVWWQKLLSIVILIITFVGSVYVSGKIYRIGLLSYGAKPSWKQMIKWLTYKG